MLTLSSAVTDTLEALVDSASVIYVVSGSQKLPIFVLPVLINFNIKQIYYNGEH